MYPTQDVHEIEQSLTDLEVRSRKVIGSVEALLTEVQDQDRRKEYQEKLNNFSRRWLDRLHTEKKGWEERRLSLKSLQDALS